MLCLRAAAIGLVLLATSKVSLAQTLIDTSKLPDCAVNCATLKSANSGCVPPAAPVTEQGTYQSCFCQSTLLVTLYSTPNGVCDAECTNTSDRQKLKDWYVGLCTGGVVVTPGGSQPTTTNTDAAATTAGTSPETETGKAGTSKPKEETWLSGHWQYIVMVVVIFVGLVGLTILGIWLKRRHDRQVDARGANVAAADASFVSLPPNMATMSHSNSPRGSALWRNSAANVTSTSMVGGTAPPAAMGAIGRPDSRAMYRQSGGAGGSGTWGRSRSGTANSSAYPPITSPQLMQAQTRGYEYPDVEPSQSQSSLRHGSGPQGRPMGRSMERVGEGTISETYAGESPPQTDRPKDI